jgi:serine/threonine protein kinase
MERDDVFQDEPSDRSPLALAPRTLLNEQFRVGRVLGVGGFGITYLAFDEVLEMVVAVKEYLPNNIAVRKTGSNTVQPLSSSGEEQDFEFGLQRFLHEARTLAKFEAHPNIVRVRTFFRENGTGYLVMNFYEGRTLAEYLAARNGFLPEQEALLIMEQVVEGLTAVHEENILHRDIDPNNVYLADNGTVVLLDFGAARAAVGERTRTMSVVLKRGYAPHEQYHSHGDQGPWTDVYACAATLYRTLTGYKPPEAAARILDDDLAPPSELVPSLSDATNEAVVKGLGVRPQDRPQTIEDFAALLPDPPSDAEPGWVGELSTIETSPDQDGGSAELRVSATHACRLYVDGSRTAELAPDETYTLGLEVGTHRLRAIRTDQSSGGTATVTASGTTIEKGSDRRMSLEALVWQDLVVTSAEEPTVVTVDFTEAMEEGTLSAATEQVEGDEAGAAPADTGSTEPRTPNGTPEWADRASDTEATTVTDQGGGPKDTSAILLGLTGV